MKITVTITRTRRIITEVCSTIKRVRQDNAPSGGYGPETQNQSGNSGSKLQDWAPPRRGLCHVRDSPARYSDVRFAPARPRQRAASGAAALHRQGQYPPFKPEPVEFVLLAEFARQIGATHVNRDEVS